MSQLKIAICEDHEDEQNRLLAAIESSGIESTITCFTCGEDLLKDYQMGTFDLIFMDIYMQTLTGIETIAKIRNLGDFVPVAFTTSSTDHTLESYRLEALKYIEKPIAEKPVHDLLHLISAKKNHAPHVLIQTQKKMLSIAYESILYIEQKSHKLILYLKDQEPLIIQGKLDAMEIHLNDQRFLRCHKSYLVNLEGVINLEKDLKIFKMKNGNNVHIRRESLSASKKAFENYLLNLSKSKHFL